MNYNIVSISYNVSRIGVGILSARADINICNGYVGKVIKILNIQMSNIIGLLNKVHSILV